MRYTVLPRVLVFVYKNGKLLMMKYSGEGEHQTQEKADRKDVYNPIGGHVEMGEDIVGAAIREAKEEAGVNLLNVKVKGVINASGFAGKNIMNFIISGETTDEPIKSSLEGELVWINPTEIDSLNVFTDLKSIMEKLNSMISSQIFSCTAQFNGRFGLEKITLQTV